MRSEEQYLELMRHILQSGVSRGDRTGTGTKSIFGAQIRYDLSEGLPLFTTKSVHFKSIVAELIWLLSGSTNVKDLNALGCTIWDEWADEHGDLGPVYGRQWRSWATPDGHSIDQIARVIESIRTNPEGRRHIVSAWNPVDVEDMALPPCHTLFQFYVANNKLSCQLYQRSADMFLGVPFNVASYSLLTMMIAEILNLGVGEFIHTIGDAHIYDNHQLQVNLQLSRETRDYPQVVFPLRDSIFDYKVEDFELLHYNPHPTIRAKVAV